MKTFLRKIFMSAAALLLATAVHAYDVTVVNEDGWEIYFNIMSFENQTCMMVGCSEGDGTQGTNLIIPKTVEVTIYGTITHTYTYNVIRIKDARNPRIVSVTLPNSIEYIGKSAFSGCSSLSSINIPESVISIEQGAFSNCPKLTSIDIPNSVTRLDACAFENCWSLSSVRLSNSIRSIGNSAFKGCESLTSIVIPASVTSIGDNAFNGCSHLSSVDISNSVTSIGDNAFSGCSELTSIRLPNSLKTIKMGAFSECQSLAFIEIPNSVTSIGESAFERCKKMNSVTLGSSIESIGELAFASCDALMKVNSRIENPFQINKNVFPTLVKSFGVLYVPKGRKTVYRATEGWSDFMNIEDGNKYLHLTMPSGSNLHAFCYNEPLDFSNVSGLKAYIAGGFDPSTNEILLVSVNEVPAGTGVILEGVAGKNYDILVNQTSFVYSNLLRGTLSQTSVSEGYVLRGNQFERVEPNTVVAAKSAYLILPASVQGPPTLSLKCLNGVTDGIDTVLTDMTPRDGHWYNLQGMRLDGSPSTPGIYIRNGRKVMVR